MKLFSADLRSLRKGQDLERLLSASAGVTTKEHSLALARAERKRWQPVHKGREHEETKQHPDD